MAEGDYNLGDIEAQLREQAVLTHQLKQQLAAIEAVAKQKMSREAISRYGAVKVAHPELAVKAIAMIAQAVQLGQIRETVGDEEFKMLLKNLQEGKAKFNFKK